jgi:predicted phosphodiesterase
MISIGLISDIHYGPDQGTKRGSLAPALFSKFAEWTQDAEIELVVDLGDRISDVDHEADLQEARVVGAAFAALTIPHFHLVGNHDVHRLTIEENEAALGLPLCSASVDIGGFHLVFFNANAKLSYDHGFSLPQSDLDWLHQDLAATTLPTVIFSHVPLNNGSMQGNFYFDKTAPHHAGYPAAQSEQIRDIIERSNKVVLCINGHTHWNAYHCIDGIHYVTIPSLTETFPTYPLVCESWARLSLSASEITISVMGNLPIEYRFPLKALKHHWLNVHKEYAPQVGVLS